MSLRDPADSPVPPAEGEDEIIELTDLVEEESPSTMAETAAEVLIRLEPEARGREDLVRAGKSEPEPGDNLDEFLASLPDLFEEPGTPDTQPAAAAPAAPALAPELTASLDEAALREMVREIIQETVERLAREMLPPLALQAIERELRRWKKILAESD